MAKSIHNNAIQAFEKAYNSSSVMLFNNRGPLTFEEAIADLFKAHKTYVGEDYTLNIEAGVDELLSAHTAKVTGEASDDQKGIIQKFDDWCGSIHNGHLQAAEGERFPKNVVYEIISSFRRAEGKTPEETLLGLRLEGANAWKIMKGQPTRDFIDTNHISDFLNAVSKLEVDAKKLGVQEYILPESIEQEQRNFATNFQELKKGEVFATLLGHKENLLDLGRVQNKDTGANQYNFKMPGAEMLNDTLGGIANEYARKEVNSLVEFLAHVNDLMQSCADHKDITEFRQKLLEWDVSSQVELACDVLKVIQSHFDISAEDKIKELEHITRVMDKNSKGDYPANERNEKLKECSALCQLWLQEDTHQESSKEEKEQEEESMTLTQGDASMGVSGIAFNSQNRRCYLSSASCNEL